MKNLSIDQFKIIRDYIDNEILIFINDKKEILDIINMILLISKEVTQEDGIDLQRYIEKFCKKRISDIIFFAKSKSNLGRVPTPKLLKLIKFRDKINGEKYEL